MKPWQVLALGRRFMDAAPGCAPSEAPSEPVSVTREEALFLGRHLIEMGWEPKQPHTEDSSEIPAHSDHPARHFDRTCAGCWAESAERHFKAYDIAHNQAMRNGESAQRRLAALRRAREELLDADSLLGERMVESAREAVRRASEITYDVIFNATHGIEDEPSPCNVKDTSVPRPCDCGAYPEGSPCDSTDPTRCRTKRSITGTIHG